MKRKIFNVLFALVLLASFSLVTAVPVAVSANGTTFAGSEITVQSLAEPYETQDEAAFIAEPETLVLDDAAFDAQTCSQVVIEGTVSALDLGDGWPDTAYVEIGLRPVETMNERNAGVYLIAFNVAGGGTRIHLQDYTGSGNANVINLPDQNAGFRYKITLEPSGDTGGTATLEVWVGELLQKPAPTLDYGYASTWEENVAGALDEDFSNAHLFYSIIAECRGAAGQTYSATVGTITIDDTLYVGTGQQFPTIQAAIDFANPGDTINVAAGTYTEHLTITGKSNLTIQSTEDAKIVPISTPSTPWTTPIIKVDSSTDITIRGLVIDGKDEVDPFGYSWASAFTGVGVVFEDSTGTIEGNEIRNFNLDSYPVERRFKPVGTGIIVLNDCPQVTIEGNDIKSYHASGIRLCYGFEGNIINIIDNVITGRGPQSYYSGESIRIDAASTVNIIGNELSNNIYNDEHGVEGDAAGVTICGAVAGPPVVNITENDIRNNTFGIIVEEAEGAVVEAHFNNIVGNGVGTAPNRGGAATQDVRFGLGDPDAWPINTTLNATHNWWGNASGPYHVGTNPLGTGDAVSGNVIFSPWFGAGVEDSKSEKTKPGADTVDARTEADTDVNKSGTGTPTITVAKYDSNPGRGFAGDTGKYIDVHIDNPAGVTEIEIRVYYTDAEITGLVESSLMLRWWDGTRWIGCSDSGVNTTDDPPYSGYMWAKIRNDTIPTLDQLSGTVFGGSGRVPTAPPPPPAPVPPPGTTDVRGVVSAAGVFLEPITATSADGLCTLTIPEGTVGLTAELEPLAEITIVIMDEPPPPPEGTHVIGLAYNFEPDGVSFEPPIELLINYDPEGLPENVSSVFIAYYDKEQGWRQLEPISGIIAAVGTATAQVSHFTTFAVIATVKPPAPAAFSLSGLEVSPAEVDIGQSVTITAVVTNTGGETGSCKAVLEIDGVIEVTKEVTISAGASEEVTFTTSRDVAGSYSVDVNGLTSSFAVKAPPEEAPPEEVPPEAKPISRPVIGGIIAGVVIVGLLIFFLVRRRATT